MDIEPITLKEKNKETEIHYLNREDVRQIVQVNWPELVPLLKDAIHPRISSHPDELEEWEVKIRQSRQDTVLNSLPPLSALMALLYEECFGVNATPNQYEKFHDSFAPSPGGMISHGYPMSTHGGTSLEEVSQFNFDGDTARGIISSLPDETQKTGIASVIAESLYPVSPSQDYLNERMNRLTTEALLRPDGKPREEVDTWGLRMIKLIKKAELYKNVENDKLRDLLNIKPGFGISIALYWNLLWKNMSPRFLSSGSYKDPNNPEVSKAIGELLRIRLAPEFQMLFKYSSPSGYLNE